MTTSQTTTKRVNYAARSVILVSALSTEPFAIIIRGNTDNRNMKLIHWFILTVADPDCERRHGTQEAIDTLS